MFDWKLVEVFLMALFLNFCPGFLQVHFSICRIALVFVFFQSIKYTFFLNFFHKSTTPRPLINALKYFRILFWILGASRLWSVANFDSALCCIALTAESWLCAMQHSAESLWTPVFRIMTWLCNIARSHDAALCNIERSLDKTLCNIGTSHDYTLWNIALGCEF
jgi:hypothetical protein